MKEEITPALQSLRKMLLIPPNVLHTRPDDLIEASVPAVSPGTAGYIEDDLYRQMRLTSSTGLLIGRKGASPENH